MIPNIIPLLFTAGIMGYFKIPLKPSTLLVFGIALGITVDNAILFLAKYRQELKLHSELYPDIKKVDTCEVQTINIDEFLNENNLETNFELVSLDTQGHDFEILTSSEFILNSKLIVIETASIELYEGQKVDKEIDKFLESKGYHKQYYHPFHNTWGDTLYVKK